MVSARTQRATFGKYIHHSRLKGHSVVEAQSLWLAGRNRNCRGKAPRHLKAWSARCFGSALQVAAYMSVTSIAQSKQVVPRSGPVEQSIDLQELQSCPCLWLIAAALQRLCFKRQGAVHLEVLAWASVLQMGCTTYALSGLLQLGFHCMTMMP